MTQRPDDQDVDIEEALVRYMVERRITRRMLLEQIGKVGAFAALAPIIAACTSAAASAAPSQAAAADGLRAAHDRPDGDRGTHRHPGADAGADAREAAEHLQLGRLYRRDDPAGLREEVRDQGQLRQVPGCVDADHQDPQRRQGRRLRPDLPGLDRRRAARPRRRDRRARPVADPEHQEPRTDVAGSRPTTRATSTQSRTTGGRPGSPGTRTRSRRTSPAGLPCGTRRTRARWGCCPTSRRCSPPGHSGWG